MTPGSNRRALRTLAGVLLAFSAGSPRFALASNIQLTSIDFKTGHPRFGESLAEATSYTPTVLTQALEANARALTAVPELGAEIAGYSDDGECLLERDCDELSLSRAKLVYKWLIEHGVPASKLKGPVGNGSQFPLDEGESEDARQLNRRVQFNLFSIKGPSQS